MRRMMAGVAVLLAAWLVSGCGSKEVRVETDNPQMDPEHKALVDEMKRVQDERDSTISVPIPPAR